MCPQFCFTFCYVYVTKAFDSILRGKMEQILLAYGIPKETVAAITILYRNTKVKVRSPDGDAEYFDIVVLYSYLHVHASQRHNIKDRRMKENAGRNEAGRLLFKHSPLTLLQGFERVVQGLHVRGCWRPNINFIFWPHCYDRHVVSFLFS